MPRVEGESRGSFATNVIKKASIVDIVFDLSKFRDVYLVIELQPEDSQYGEKTWIVGDFEKGTDGTIKGNWLINKINEFLDVINYSGGFNIRGEFENPAGHVIAKDQIANELKEHIVKNNCAEIYAYFYKEWNEVEGKAYSRIFQPFAKLSDYEKLMNKITKQIKLGETTANRGIRPYVEGEKPATTSGYAFEKDIACGDGDIPQL